MCRMTDKRLIRAIKTNVFHSFHILNTKKKYSQFLFRLNVQVVYDSDFGCPDAGSNLWEQRSECNEELTSDIAVEISNSAE